MKRTVLAALIGCALAIAGCGSSTPQSATGSVHPSGWGSTPKGYVMPRSLLGIQPTALMYDSTDTGAVPAHPFAGAGYTAGHWVTWPWFRAHAAHAISIAVQAVFHADCLDVEPLNAIPAQAGPWVLADIRAGFKRPCVYSDLSEMPAVQASLRASLGASWRARVFLWLAWYRHVPGLVPGYDAVQYDDHCLGRNLDCSTVTLAFLGIAQPPYVAPRPLPICFHHRLSEARCAAAHAQVASDQQASVASGRMLAVAQDRLARHSCERPFRRATCVRSGRIERTMAWRVQWFAARAAAVEAAN